MIVATTVQNQAVIVMLAVKWMKRNHCLPISKLKVIVSRLPVVVQKMIPVMYLTKKLTPQLLADNNVCAAMWPDWWGFKMEAYDMTLENIAIVDSVKNSCAIVHSDSQRTIQRLNQEAAKVLYRAQSFGFKLDEADAIKWITSNAAKALGIAEFTGSIEEDKQADLVLWNQNPFSVYAQAQQVFVDGAKVYDRNDPRYQAVSDFNLGQSTGAQ